MIISMAEKWVSKSKKNARSEKKENKIKNTLTSVENLFLSDFIKEGIGDLNEKQ